MVDMSLFHYLAIFSLLVLVIPFVAADRPCAAPQEPDFTPQAPGIMGRVCILNLGSTLLLGVAHVWFGFRGRQATKAAETPDNLSPRTEAPMQADGVAP